MEAELMTARLLLRRPTADDRDDYVRLFAHADVTRFLFGVRPPEESAAALERMLEQWRRHGYGVWTVLERSTDRFVGRCGLRWQEKADAAELLYTLHRDFWGRGIATEAAAASLRYGFEQAGLPKIIALTDPANFASRRVLEKLGMRFDGERPFEDGPAAWYVLTREEQRG
jgi:ribosomal-protein-alanine N-acetyltransferase